MDPNQTLGVELLPFPMSKSLCPQGPANSRALIQKLIRFIFRVIFCA